MESHGKNRVFFITFGCKVNLTETEAMKKIFCNEGFRAASDESEADIFVINSCTVTDTADLKLKKTLSRLRRSYPAAIIALTGCYSEIHPEKTDFADIIIGTSGRNKLPGMIKNQIAKSLPPENLFAENNPPAGIFEDFSLTNFTGNTRAFLKIQDGCNMNCAYCIIPKTRGSFRSKPLESVISDAKTLCENGFKEIVLTGINLAFYGVEFGLRLINAVEAIADNATGVRIRLGSLEPEIISDSDIARLKEINVCPHFHLSLQSACDRTLERMNRHIKIAQYMKLVAKLRENFPLAAITTDIIVGFPGETEEDFAISCANIEKIGFANIHIFPYSKREGTAAADMPCQIPENVKKNRAKILAEIAEKSRREFEQSFIGKTLNVLFEKEKTPGFHRGFSENYIHVEVSGEGSWRNELFPVHITGVTGEGLLGEIVRDN
ncbi:MAG: tRNA (N(6)-L-threonylcarbamoyladenosine(37)-C(2))-methylthiotransferase MtaB [Ruminococcus sp.]|nr:tRNA (N(6)-L-threonylcarbamoyladenosine(37)-C(2))-methylthiotransferase MtaB [Ruminococcus sp.]